MDYSDIDFIYGKNSNDRFIRASTANISGVSASFTNGSFTNISGNISNTTGYPTSSLTGTITNDQLAGSIENSKLVNSSFTLGDVDISLGRNASSITGLTNISGSGNVVSRFTCIYKCQGI